MILATYTKSSKTNILIPIRPNNQNICCPLCTSGPGPLGPWISDAWQTFWDQGAKSKAKKMAISYRRCQLWKSSTVFKTFNYSIIYKGDHEVSSAITFPSNFSLQMLLERTLDRTNTLTQAYTSLLTGRAIIQFSQRPWIKHPIWSSIGVTGVVTSYAKWYYPLKNSHHLKRDHDSKRKAHLLVPAFFRGYSFVFRKINLGLTHHNISPTWI